MYGEAMEVVMAALTKDVVDFHGKYFDFTNVPIELKPYQLPHPPLWYATNSAESAAKAARQNMNIVTLVDSAEAAKVIAGYKDGWSKSHGASGKRMPRAGVTRFVYVADSDRHAQERGAFGSRKFYESLVYLWRKFNVGAMSLEEVIRSAEATLIAGTPATVRAKIERDIEVSGANYYVPRFAYGNLTHEESVRSLELFTDGTGDIADKLAEADPHVQVMHRDEKAGLGKAYIAGFGWALERGYDAIVEMDADGSHLPEHLPVLVGALAHADLAIGSRWMPGGKVVNWPKSREVLSRGANVYTRLMLGLSVRDATAGFRAYRASTLRTISLDQVESAGYCFQIDLTNRVAQAGLRIVEVPITFVEREHGASKMSNNIILEAFWRVAQWGVAKRVRGLGSRRASR